MAKDLILAIIIAVCLTSYGSAQDSLGTINVISSIHFKHGDWTVDNGLLIIDELFTDSLLLFDVEDPAHPIQTTAIMTEEGYAFDIGLHNDIAFVAEQSGPMKLYDTGEGDTLVYIRDWGSSISTAVAFVNDILYYTILSRLYVADIRDPNNPDELGSVLVSIDFTWNVFTDGQVALVPTLDGISIADVSSVDNMEQVATIEGSGQSIAAFWRQFAYVADFYENENLRVFDLTNPSEPQQIGEYNPDGMIVHVVERSDRLYVSGSYGLEIFQITVDGSLTHIGENEDLSGWQVEVDDRGLIYVSQSFNQDSAQIFICSFTPFDATPEIEPRPSSFILYPSYPNPFNSSVTLSYRLDRRSPVSVRIYDTAGHEITSLFNGIATRGNHNLIWNAGNLPGGVYIGKLEAGDYVGSVRLVLVK